MTPTHIFSTDRLKVRTYTTEDHELFFALNGNALVMQYIRAAKNREESKAYLQENISFYLEHPGMGRWAVFEKTSGGFVGSFAVLPIPEVENNIQIGYALLPEHWGKGYASELTKQGIQYAFGMFGIDDLFAITESPNIASQKVLMRAGFKEQRRMMENGKELILYILKKADALQIT
jgi:[ribosomal protein S5]-alanine N-acetyltransferase